MLFGTVDIQGQLEMIPYPTDTDTTLDIGSVSDIYCLFYANPTLAGTRTLPTPASRVNNFIIIKNLAAVAVTIHTNGLANVLDCSGAYSVPDHTNTVVLQAGWTFSAFSDGTDWKVALTYSPA